MLGYDKIDLSKGIDASKTDDSRECITCHYWYFLGTNFKFKPEVCNGRHDLMQKAISFNDVAIVSAKGNDCGINFWYLSKY